MYLEVVEALLKIKAGVYNERWGICGNLEYSLRSKGFDCWCTTGKQAFKDWSKFSGNKYYPVPFKSSESAAWAFVSLNKWSKRSQYGRDRWELLDHLIQWYSDKAKEEDAQEPVSDQ